MKTAARWVVAGSISPSFAGVRSTKEAGRPRRRTGWRATVLGPSTADRGSRGSFPCLPPLLPTRASTTSGSRSDCVLPGGPVQGQPRHLGRFRHHCEPCPTHTRESIGEAFAASVLPRRRPSRTPYRHRGEPTPRAPRRSATGGPSSPRPRPRTARPAAIPSRRRSGRRPETPRPQRRRCTNAGRFPWRTRRDRDRPRRY